MDRTDYAELFRSVNEPFLYGLYEDPDRSPTYRFSNAYKRMWEKVSLTPYCGGKLYPNGINCERNCEKDGFALRPTYSFTYNYDKKLLKSKTTEGFEYFDKEDSLVFFPPGPHTVGGNCFTHCFPNYKRILTEGLNGYLKRVEALPDDDFKDGMLILLEGIKTYHSRCLQLLIDSNADIELINALKKVPFSPPETLYEALVALNFIYYIDGCDDIGALDRNLLPYYRGEDVVDIIREFFHNVDVNDGWSGTLGPDYNDLTIQCIKAIHNGRRPNLQLLVTDDMPDEIWHEVYASLSTSCGQPALYNYSLYLKTMHKLMPEIKEEDYVRLAFGGCTETMLEGISCVGSDDAGINTALVFEQYMREHLTECSTFEEFFDGLCREEKKTVITQLEYVNKHKQTRALYRSQPLHTLFVDDCIENRKDFNDGGARYCWGVANVAGLVNVIDSLLVIRELVFDKKIYSSKEFLELLDKQDEVFLNKAKEAPCYGVDDEKADSLAAEFTKAVFSAFNKVDCYPSGKYYPVSNQFTTYEYAGRDVGPTPDGRKNGAPLCDSLGAVFNKDTKGPTALLNSVSALPLSMAIGTPVVNIRISKEHLPKVLKPLTLGFFNKGGMQLQISCLSREEMKDAVVYPEAHKNLVVRVGGFSEYFTRLSPVMQQTVIDRTEY